MKKTSDNRDYAEILSRYVDPQRYPNFYQLFLHKGSLHTLAAGENLVQQEQEAEAFCLVLTGDVEISMVLPDGQLSMITRAGSGAWHGDLPYLDGGKLPWRMDALTQVTEIRLPFNALNQNSVPDGELYGCIATNLARRMRMAHDFINQHKVKSVKERLLLKLTKMADDAGEVTITQEKLAAFIGVDRNKIYRTLRTLESEGMLSVGYRKIRLLQSAPLQ
ncbi:Crp/Fnr family transcriptional regulator [Ferrimonas pelagia]